MNQMHWAWVQHQRLAMAWCEHARQCERRNHVAAEQSRELADEHAQAAAWYARQFAREAGPAANEPMPEAA